MVKKKTKVKQKLFVILLLCVGIGTGFFYALNMNQTDEVDKIVENHTGKLKGKIADATMNTMSVRDDKNHLYLMSHMDMEVAGAPLIIGNDVVVEYDGQLQQTKDLQDIDIKKITVHETQIQNVDVTEDIKEPEKQKQPTPKGHTKEIGDLIGTMTLEEKVAQMFFVRCPDDDAAKFVKDFQIGGYILFAQDFKGKTVNQVRNNIKSYQKNSKIPMLIGTDEEGGTVVRVSRYLRSERFKSPQELYKAGGMNGIIRDTQTKSRFLLDLGINVNFAPVADVSTNKHDFINARAFGKEAKQTSQYVQTVVKSMYKSHIGSVLKHFPGYGNNKDTHTQICVDDRQYSVFKKSDFLPFKAGATAGADSVLVSHNIVKSMDKNNPSSLSPKVHQILRDELGFKGVIMTDDLLMDGVRQLDTDENIAVKAVQAGNDMLISSDAKVQIEAVINAVKDGRISENQIDDSVMRVLTWKKDLGILKM